LSIVAKKNLYLEYLYVKITFLNGLKFLKYKTRKTLYASFIRVCMASNKHRDSGIGGLMSL